MSAPTTNFSILQNKIIARQRFALHFDHTEGYQKLAII